MKGGHDGGPPPVTRTLAPCGFPVIMLVTLDQDEVLRAQLITEAARGWGALSWNTRAGRWLTYRELV